MDEQPHLMNASDAPAGAVLPPAVVSRAVATNRIQQRRGVKDPVVRRLMKHVRLLNIPERASRVDIKAISPYALNLALYVTSKICATGRKDRDRLNAAKLIMDRLGMPAKRQVSVTQGGESQDDILREMLEEARRSGHGVAAVADACGADTKLENESEALPAGFSGLVSEVGGTMRATPASAGLPSVGAEHVQAQGEASHGA